MKKEFIIVRDGEIISYEYGRKSAIETVEDFRSQYPTRTYELYEHVPKERSI